MSRSLSARPGLPMQRGQIDLPARARAGDDAPVAASGAAVGALGGGGCLRERRTERGIGLLEARDELGRGLGAEYFSEQPAVLGAEDADGVGEAVAEVLVGDRSIEAVRSRPAMSPSTAPSRAAIGAPLRRW
ncbi:MAG: hypothetical protein R3B46_11530 [Phycisphaerales bacterium]